MTKQVDPWIGARVKREKKKIAIKKKLHYQHQVDVI